MSEKETMKPELEFVGFVGIDCADQKHVCCLQAAGSAQREFGASRLSGPTKLARAPGGTVNATDGADLACEGGVYRCSARKVSVSC